MFLRYTCLNNTFVASDLIHNVAVCVSGITISFVKDLNLQEPNMLHFNCRIILCFTVIFLMISNTKAEHFESKYYIFYYYIICFFLFYDTTMEFFFV